MGRRDPDARAESLRRAAEYRLEQARQAEDAGDAGPEDPGSAGTRERDDIESGDAARAGAAPFHDLDQLPRWVDTVIAEAERRGEFDDLPLTGKPLPGLNRVRDPDWWVKDLVERENLTGIAPAAYGLRTEDAALDERLDRQGSEKAVRAVLDDFNARVVEARRQLLGGPPVVTPTRNVDLEVARWRERRAARQDAHRPAASERQPSPRASRRESRRKRRNRDES